MSKFTTINPVIRFLGMEGRVISEGQRALRVMSGGFGVTHKGKVFPVVADASGVTGTCDVIGGATKAVEKDDASTRPAKFADIGKATAAETKAALAKANPKAPKAAAVTAEVAELKAQVAEMSNGFAALAALIAQTKPTA